MESQQSNLQELYDAPIRSVLASHREFFAVILNSLREHVDRFHAVMSQVHQLNPASILDVGCSFGIVGALTQWQRGQNQRLLHGCDVSPLACAYAKSVMEYDEAFCGDARSLPFPQTYDLVLCLEVLEHLEDSEAMVRRVSELTHRHALFSVPVEEGEVDGVFHVKHIDGGTLGAWVKQYFSDVQFSMVPSEFCEKPHWQGWLFCLATKEQ